MNQIHLLRTMRVFTRKNKNSSGKVYSAKNSCFQNAMLIQLNAFIYSIYFVFFKLSLSNGQPGEQTTGLPFQGVPLITQYSLIFLSYLIKIYLSFICVSDTPLHLCSIR